MTAKPKKVARETLEPWHIHVTDHAVIRYLERVKGLDVEATRRHIADVCKGVRLARCVRAEGFDFVIKERCVVTVRPNGAANPRRVPR